MQLYKKLCLSVRLSVGPCSSVHPSVMMSQKVEKNEHFVYFSFMFVCGVGVGE